MMQDPLVGKVIDGRYEIQARIGEGGMGVVYKARQISIDRVIALKMLDSQMATDPARVRRFYNEAKACSRLQHPNTIRMFDFGQTSDGRLFMTMELLDGVSLRAALSKGPLAPERMVKILIQCCAALAEAHSIGIIHRDIKPDNVFLLNMAGSPDFVKLLDFSVATLLEGDRMKTQAGVVFGTPQYMSPEQGRGLPLDARSDLYALGILAFEMLTGNVPFHDENPMTTIQMHLHAGVPPLAQSIPYSVQQIVRRSLEKDASRRYQSSGEMMQHFQQVFAEVSQGGMSIGAGGQPTSPMQKTTVAAAVMPQMSQTPGRLPDGHPQMHQMAPDAAASGPSKTMMTHDGEGGVSVARAGQAAQRRSPRVGAAVVATMVEASAAGVRPLVALASAAVHRARAARAQRTARRALDQLGGVSASPHAAVPPCAIAYRPSWVSPRRQTSIHVYIVLPEAQHRVHKEAREALDAPGNPARKSPSIPLWRIVAEGEALVVHVQLAGFDIGDVEPVAWRPPHVRFVVPIRAHADVALGIHRPIVTVRCAGTSREMLATFDFDLDVRASSPRVSMLTGALVGGCAVTASAVLTATAQHSIPSAVGWPVSAACVVGAASTWAMKRTKMIPADARDRATIFMSYVQEDRERVKRAIHLLQECQRFPPVDAERAVAERQPIDTIERADRVFVFWSGRTRTSREVTREWQTAVKQVGAASDHSRFIMPILLGHDRPEEEHPLARFESIDLGALADALIVTAVKEEYEAVLGVDTGAVPHSAWQRRVGPTRLEVALREFAVETGVLRIAVTQALGMGGVSAVEASSRLIDAYRVRCLAMCGVCAGRRGDVELGDVIIADRLWQYDAGKRTAAVDPHGRRTAREQADIDMYKIQPPEWKQVAERFQFDDSASWLAARPRSYAEQGNWLLERILNQSAPATDPGQSAHCPDYEKALARLWANRFLIDGKLELTDAGRAHITRHLTLHRGRLPAQKPLRLHVGPIASGNKVMEDAEVFPLLADSVRKVLGVEMEAAAIGALANSAQLPYSVVMKAVMDHADTDKSDNFKAFAARASAECLIAFLRKHLPPRTPPIP